MLVRARGELQLVPRVIESRPAGGAYELDRLDHIAAFYP